MENKMEKNEKKTEENINNMFEDEISIKKRKLEDGSETGLHNWRNLFKKPGARDWLDFAILGMVIALYFIYKHETGVIMEALNNCLQNRPII